MIKFIKKLIKENKIKTTDPSNHISESYLKKSLKSLISAKTLLEIENLEDAVALAYYSMYYSSLALLFYCGIKSENHTGSIFLIKEIFELDNEDLKKAKKERIDKQYYVDFQVTKKEVMTDIYYAEEFNSKIRDFIERMSESQRKTFHEKAKRFFSSKN
ncbi:MAG: HEPN domain-containing protein [Candidatus Woesearchaeota archaeon]